MTEAGAPRMPKGILKNKYGGSSSSRDGSGHAGDVPDQMGYASALNYGGVPGWDPQLGMMATSNKSMPIAPVPAPQQHLMNMPNPALHDPILRGIKSEFSPLQQKLHDFINSKRGLLFRPLDPDETPVSEVKGIQRNAEDHYGIVPSFDHFLRIDLLEIKRHFLQNAQVGDLLIGKVISRSNAGISIKIVCTEGGKQVILDDTNIRSFCPTQHTIPVADPRDPSRYYDIDDFVRIEILEVNPDTEKIISGMKGVTLSPELQHSVQMGLISRQDLPRYYTLTNYKHSRDPRFRRLYQEMLKESPGFQNPSSVSHLATNMGIYNNSNSLIKGIRYGFPPREKATQLRRIQNAKWAHGHVAEGIKFFKAEKFTEAFQSLNNALNIDAENVEGLVARGALYANNGNYEKAIDDFESALKFNPNHFNARKYLAETLVALGRQQESQGKLEDAIASYSKSLVVRADHKEATEALLSLHARTEKLDPSKMTGAAAAKAAELKAKLKTILQGELGFKMESKLSKEKKSRKDKRKKDSSASEDDSSSSSSSDESSSDSSSSGSGYKKKSKKRKKKKSKKSKKNRKESKGERKQKELSLSPFSKRLVEPHGVGIPPTSAFSGFTDSTYAVLQLGIPKQDNEDSDNESKRSSKKSKDKKRSKKSKDKKKKRHASSDSSTSNSESERSKKKKKQAENENASLIIPGLEDLEAKLSAYYSKIEQGKLETKEPSRRSRSRSRSKGRERRSRSRSPEKRPRNLYDDVPPRVVENLQPKKPADEEKILEKSWSERKPGKIDLQTDDYGNIVQPQTIIRTVKNDVTIPEPNKPARFEMKFKPLNNSTSNDGENGATSNAPPPPDLGSKWRPLGAASMQSEAVKNAFERESSIHSGEDPKDDRDRNSTREDRNYRRRSHSTSKSPPRRRRRSRSYSRSLSRSRSRSRSYSRSRSRSRSPSYRRDRRSSYRRDVGPRGRAPARFFRGYNYNRGRRSYNPRPYGRDRDYGSAGGGGGGGSGGGSGRSRFRNRFSHTPSRSRSRSQSRSRSRSISPRDRRRDHSRDRDHKSFHLDDPRIDKPLSPNQDAVTSKMEADSASQLQDANPSPVNTEIQIGSLKTTNAADVEYLLDKRNAEKKEEMRKSNPDFFRNT